MQADKHRYPSRRRRSRSRDDERDRKARRYDGVSGSGYGDDGANGSHSSSRSKRYNDDAGDSRDYSRSSSGRDRERDRDSHRDYTSRDRDDRYRSSRGSRDEYGGDSRRGRDGRDGRNDYDSRRGADYSSSNGRRDDRGGRGGRDSGRSGGGAGGGTEVFGAGNQQRSPTPEATIPISKRKRTRTAWDIRAPGFETFTTMQAKMTGMFNLPGQARPMTGYTSMSTSMPSALPDLHLGFGGVSPSVAMSMSTGGAAFARQARRLYVGNITLEASEQNVGEFFNRQMREKGFAIDNDPAGVQGPDPVVSVQVNHEKSYAFVEFRSAQEATAALVLDGIVFQSQVLKVRRPKDYIGTEHSATTHIPGVVSTNVPDTPNKIFIGGLPSYLTDVQVIELLQSFGELRAFNLVKEGSTNASRGFAFCEYVDPSVTDIACQGLNGMEVGDRYLVVQRAAIGANSKMGGGFGGDMNMSMGVGGVDKVAPNIIAAATAGETVATRVLQMLNMVTPEELAKEDEYEEILEDIREECSKYGQVVDVKVPRPAVTDSGKYDQRASEGIEDLGKVFVMFETIDDTKKAMMSIAGRQFGGRSIICAFADPEKMV